MASRRVVDGMVRKVVKVYLPSQMAKIIEAMNRDYGISEMEIMRWAFSEFAASKGYVSMSHLDPTELSDHPVQSIKDQAIINALKAARNQDPIDWRIYAEIGLNDRDILDFLIKYVMKSEGKVDQVRRTDLRD